MERKSTLYLLQRLQQALREQPEQSLADFWSTLSELPPSQAVLVGDEVLRQELYGRIARPWERLKRQKQKKSVLGKLPATDWCVFEVLNLQPQLMRKPLTVGFLLEFLRNAISHDKVKIETDTQVVFSDWEHNRIRFSLQELLRLMEALAAFRNA
jgi:hypothetical protein